MFFKKKRSTEPPQQPVAPGVSSDDVPESHRVGHGRFTILPAAKQLHNGNWIVSIVLEETTPEGPRRYDFFGPMTEYPSEEDARAAGVKHAIARLDK